LLLFPTFPDRVSPPIGNIEDILGTSPTTPFKLVEGRDEGNTLATSRRSHILINRIGGGGEDGPYITMAIIDDNRDTLRDI
jgi:hypothetical protein